MQIVNVTIMQTNGSQVFNSASEAESFIETQLSPSAEEGETFEVKVDPTGTGRALIETFFNGKSEGFF